MKSDIEQLERRGFVANGDEDKLFDTSFEQCIRLLKSNIPIERTLGARLLSVQNNLRAIEYLVEGLKIEKKLYCKIEIGNALVTFDKDSVKPLIEQLGKIGNNQYRKVPEKCSKKKSFPLPRDIAGRVLIRIGENALPDLLNVLESRDLIRMSEAIDAIGFICFYEKQSSVYEKLVACFDRNRDNDLITWKIVVAMSAFPESESFLNEQKQRFDTQLLLSEIERSLLFFS